MRTFRWPGRLSVDNAQMESVLALLQRSARTAAQNLPLAIVSWSHQIPTATAAN